MRSSKVAPAAPMESEEKGADGGPRKGAAGQGDGLPDAGHGRRRWLNRQNPSQAHKDLKRELVTMQSFEVAFKPWIFARMLLWHITYPVCLPAMYAYEGYALCKNTGFIFRRWKDAWFNFGASVLLWVALIVLAIQPPDSELTHIVHTPETMAMILSFLKLTIATKYAYMPSERFKRFQTTRVSLREAHEMQRKTGWLSIPPRTVKHGVEAAAMRLGSEGTKRYFVLDDAEIARVREMLRTPVDLLCGESAGAEASLSVVDLIGNSPLWAHALETAMTTNRLSVPLLCMYLVLVHEGGGERWIKRTYRSLGPVLVTVNMAIPFLARAVAGRPMLGQSMFTAFIVLLVPFLTAGWLSVVILFLFIGVLDYRRRQLYMRRVGALMQPSLKPESAAYPLPSVSLRQPANFKSWMTARRIMLSFGLDFWRRIQMYTTYMGMTFGLLLLWYTVELLSGNPSVELTAFVLVDAAVLFALLLPTLRYGDLTNHQANVHARVFVNAQLDIRDELIGHSRALPPMGDRVAGAADGRLAHKRLAARSALYGSGTPHAEGSSLAPAPEPGSGTSPLPAGFVPPSSFMLSQANRLQGAAGKTTVGGTASAEGQGQGSSTPQAPSTGSAFGGSAVSPLPSTQALQVQMMDACLAAGLDPEMCAPVLGARVRIATPPTAATMPLDPAPGFTGDGQLSTAPEVEEEEEDDEEEDGGEEEEKEGESGDSGLGTSPRPETEGGSSDTEKGAAARAEGEAGGLGTHAPKANAVRDPSLAGSEEVGGTVAVGGGDVGKGGSAPVARPPLHVLPEQAHGTPTSGDRKTVVVNALLISSQQLEQCDALCQAVEEALLCEVQADPTTLLGFRASKTVLRSLIALGASTGSLVLRVLTGQ